MVAMHSRLDRKTVRAASWVLPPYSSPRRVATAGAGMDRLMRAAPITRPSSPGTSPISAQAATGNRSSRAPAAVKAFLSEHDIGWTNERSEPEGEWDVERHETEDSEEIFLRPRAKDGGEEEIPSPEDGGEPEDGVTARPGNETEGFLAETGNGKVILDGLKPAEGNTVTKNGFTITGEGGVVVFE